jgi:hypothetical protein
MFPVTTTKNPRAGKPGDFRIREVSDEDFGHQCALDGCTGLAMFFIETRGKDKFAGRRSCTDHAHRWWKLKTEGRPVKELVAKKAIGRPKSAEKRERIHVTLGELSLEILASHLAADPKFNHSRFIDKAIRFAQASPEFQERLKKP